ncbi:MAG: hypothetical protein ACYSUI_10405 [Planctomycetota bacterium]|jgi:hypothetical protein
MNKPLLIILLAAAVALLVYRLGFQSTEEPLSNIEVEEDKADPFLQAPPPGEGVETEETPEFEVVMATKHVGMQQKLEFTIIEAHGWWVKRVYVQAYYGNEDPETGEFERANEFPVKMLCSEVIKFGKPLVCETTLTDPELTSIGGEVGDGDDWQGEVYDWGKVYKPK